MTSRHPAATAFSTLMRDCIEGLRCGDTGDTIDWDSVSAVLRMAIDAVRKGLESPPVPETRVQ